MKTFQLCLFVAVAMIGMTNSFCRPVRGARRFREALEEAPTGATGSATGAAIGSATGAVEVPPAPVVPKENPIIAAYKEKMELCKVQCDEAKSLTFNASDALNTSIAVVQKFMTSAAEEVSAAKKSESEDGGESTLESLTNSQKNL